jgi:2'-5' RNA ligase/ribosomal protein S18 acetylase RimI-like enzyme
MTLMVGGRVADEIDGLRRALGSREIEKIRPHITLVPPVNVSDPDVAAACDVVRAAAAMCGPLRLELGPLATFLPVNPVCYLAVSGEPPVATALSALVGRLATEPLAPPPARPARPFVPHVTINQSMDLSLVKGAVEALSAYRATVAFETVTLLEFFEGERRWLPLADAPLGGPSVSGRGGREIELTTSERLDPLAERWAAHAWDQYSREQYGGDLRPYEHFAITARVGGAVVGVAEGEVRTAVCHLARLIVAPDQRSAGIGAQLLRGTERLALERGCERVRLETLAGGRAEGFYRERGYEGVAPLPRWREERDFVLMERNLGPG